MGSVAAFYVFMVPYTKVEESFNIQVQNQPVQMFLNWITVFLKSFLRNLFLGSYKDWEKLNEIEFSIFCLGNAWYFISSASYREGNHYLSVRPLCIYFLKSSVGLYFLPLFFLDLFIYFSFSLTISVRSFGISRSGSSHIYGYVTCCYFVLC